MGAQVTRFKRGNSRDIVQDMSQGSENQCEIQGESEIKIKEAKPGCQEYQQN